MYVYIHIGHENDAQSCQAQVEKFNLYDAFQDSE